MSLFKTKYIDYNNYQKTILSITKRIVEILGDKKNQQRASDSARYMLDCFDKTIEKNKHNIPKIDCKKGCWHCCMLYVSARIPEFFYLADFIRNNTNNLEKTIKNIKEKNSKTKKLNEKEKLEIKETCPLLEDCVCKFYQARPLPCRTLASDNLQTCLECIKGEKKNIITPDIHTTTRANLDMALWAGLKANNLSKESYELNSALITILEDENAEKKWLAGEDIFKNAKIDNQAEKTAFMPNESDIDVLLSMALSS